MRVSLRRINELLSLVGLVLVVMLDDGRGPYKSSTRFWLTTRRRWENLSVYKEK